MSLPAIRQIEATPVTHEGQQLICLHDVTGVVEEQLLVSPAVYFIAAYLDGHTDAAGIQEAFAQQSGGTRLSAEDIHRVVQYLDSRGFLATPAFDSIYKEVRDTFHASSERLAYSAGKAYPNDPAELKPFLDDCLACADAARPSAAPPVRCLIAPHIDFQRGARVYGHAYGRLAAQPAPELAFIFGVAHAGSSSPYILTKKHFETPLGLMPTAADIVDRLADGCTWDPYEDELLHRIEHSIEFQAVMLAHVFGTGVRLVPILCGALDARAGAHAFLQRCQSVVAESAGRAVVIAGADLAHVGIRFGDPFDIDDTAIERIRQRDMEDLAHVLARDGDAFQESVWRDGNARRVCGLGCIHAALKATGPAASHAEMLAYDYAHDPAGGIVSFAAIALT